MRRLNFILAVLMCPGLLFAQVRYNEGHYIMSYSTENLQPKEVEIIDGVCVFDCA